MQLSTTQYRKNKTHQNQHSKSIEGEPKNLVEWNIDDSCYFGISYISNKEVSKIIHYVNFT